MTKSSWNKPCGSFPGDGDLADRAADVDLAADGDRAAFDGGLPGLAILSTFSVSVITAACIRLNCCCKVGASRSSRSVVGRREVECRSLVDRLSSSCRRSSSFCSGEGRLRDDDFLRDLRLVDGSSYSS